MTKRKPARRTVTVQLSLAELNDAAIACRLRSESCIDNDHIRGEKTAAKRWAQLTEKFEKAESAPSAGWTFPIRYKVCKKCRQGLTREQVRAGRHHCRLGTVPVAE